MCATPRALTRFSCARLFVLDHIQQRVWHAQVFYRATADVALFDFPKAVAVCARLVYLAKRDVHKIVAVDEVSIERFSVLELDQHRLVLCSIEK